MLMVKLVMLRSELLLSEANQFVSQNFQLKITILKNFLWIPDYKHV